MITRSGVSAQIPAVEPITCPAPHQFCGQPATTSYGPRDVATALLLPVLGVAADSEQNRESRNCSGDSFLAFPQCGRIVDQPASKCHNSSQLCEKSAHLVAHRSRLSAFGISCSDFRRQVREYEIYAPVAAALRVHVVRGVRGPCPGSRPDRHHHRRYGCSALPGVTVTALHEATGNRFVAITDERGIYRTGGRDRRPTLSAASGTPRGGRIAGFTRCPSPPRPIWAANSRSMQATCGIEP